MLYTRLDTLQSIDLSCPEISRLVMYGAPFNADLVRASALYREPSHTRVPYLRLRPGSLWAMRLVPQIALDTRAAQLAFLSARDGWQCFYCGKDIDSSTATVEHIVCTAHGGPTHADNLCLTCGACNAAVGSLPAVQKVKLAIATRVGAVALSVFKDQNKRRIAKGSAK